MTPTEIADALRKARWYIANAEKLKDDDSVTRGFARALIALSDAPVPSDDSFVTKLAKVICEANNVRDFKCFCPDPIDGWCLGARLPGQARAAIAAINAELRARREKEP
jgi:hypothetical protein